MDEKVFAANTTTKEINFLNGLAGKGWADGHTAVRAKTALRGYIATCKTRVFDDGVDAVKVLHHANQLLSEI